jgi:hypothetical protein
LLTKLRPLIAICHSSQHKGLPHIYFKKTAANEMICDYFEDHGLLSSIVFQRLLLYTKKEGLASTYVIISPNIKKMNLYYSDIVLQVSAALSNEELAEAILDCLARIAIPKPGSEEYFDRNDWERMGVLRMQHGRSTLTKHLREFKNNKAHWSACMQDSNNLSVLQVSLEMPFERDSSLKIKH